MKAIIYNNIGKILRIIDGPPDYLIIQKQENEFILFGDADDSNQYINVESAELRDIPPKPTEYSEFNWDIKEWESNFSILQQQIDIKRITLLQQSDWTDTASAQTRLTNYEEWQTYRQALRDIPTQSGYPENVIWPEQPN